MAISARKMNLSQLPQEAADELYDFYRFLLQKHRRIHRKKKNDMATGSYPLRGLPYQYDAPFEPVASEDWEILQTRSLSLHQWLLMFHWSHQTAKSLHTSM